MRQLRKERIETAMAALKEKAIDHVYFTACEDSQAVLIAGQYLFDKELIVPRHVYTVNEFSCAIPRGLSENSLVITCSHSGTTPETIEATKKARKFGAMTICLSDEKGSPLREATGYPVYYDWDKDVDAGDLDKGILYGLLFNILPALDGSKKWKTCLNEFDELDDLVITEKSRFEITAKGWGKNQKRDKIIYTVDSDTNYGEIYSTAARWFMGMQWINSNAIHSEKFLHGPFEITDYDVPFILVKSIGDTRFLDQRVEDFTKKFSNKLMALNQAGSDLKPIDSVTKGCIAAVLSGVVIRQTVEAIAFGKGHSLGARRYM